MKLLILASIIALSMVGIVGVQESFALCIQNEDSPHTPCLDEPIGHWSEHISQEPFELQKGVKEASFGAVPIHFRLLDVEDSRCPSDVQCVWEGQVAVNVDVTVNWEQLGSYTISLDEPLDGSLIQLDGYSLQLMKVEPYPTSTELIPVSDYVVTIKFMTENESFAETDKKYKPPYQQIRDEGILPVNVKCNEGKVLFFKFPDISPVCIFDSSIKKLVFTDRVFFGWNIKENLVDWSYVQNKMNELEFENLTYVSVSNLDMVISPAHAPLISLTQEFKSDFNSDVLFYTHHSTMSEEIMPEPYTKSNYPYPFHDPRFQDYNGLYDSAISMSFSCKDTTIHVGPANPEIHVFYDIDKLTITGYAKSKSISSNDVTNSIPNTYQFEFGSSYSTQFQSDDTLAIQDISEIQCVQDDLLFSSKDTIYYYYTVSFEMPNTIEVTE